MYQYKTHLNTTQIVASPDCLVFVQVILMTVESSKMPSLLNVLDFNPAVGQKSLIVTNSALEVEEVFKVTTAPSLHYI